MNAKEYKAALQKIEKLMDSDPPKRSVKGRRLLYLATEVECYELKQTLELIHKSDMQAIKMWQKAHPGNDLVWPDRGKMIFWLLEQLDAKK